MLRDILDIALVLALTGCGCGASPPVTTRAPPPVAPHGLQRTPAFEVHEWGLVRGTARDTILVSGPRAPEPIMVVAKPVLYFHRDAARPGESALVVDVEARIPGGRIVEHWPSAGEAAGTVASWHGVVVQDGSCHGDRYPTLAEHPCSGLSDGCEAATLASVETTDSDCAYWRPPPGGDGPTQAWNHLFYRGELSTRPPLPLRLEPGPNGALRITAEGSESVP